MCHPREVQEAAVVPLRGEIRPGHELPRALRPREKLFTHGGRALSHAELLAVLLGHVGRDRPVEGMANRLMRRHGLSGLARVSASTLKSQDGLGAASAARLCAALELGRRAWKRDESLDRPRLNGPRLAFRQVRHLTESC